MQLRLKLGLSNQAGNFLRFFYCQCEPISSLSKQMLFDIANPNCYFEILSD